MGNWQLRKIESLSNDRAHVYECNACVWIVYVTPDRHPDEIREEFDEHDCKEHPRAGNVRR